MNLNAKLKIALLVFFSSSICHAQWTKMADAPSETILSSAFGIGNKAYVVDSRCDNELWEYDLVTDTWAQKKKFPGACRIAAVAFALNGKGYYGTGAIPPSVFLNDWWEYDPANDSWTQKSLFPPGGRSDAVAFAIANKGYLGTGSALSSVDTFYNDFWQYDPILDTWNQKADLVGLPRHNAVGIAMNGKGYIGLGYDESGSGNFTDFMEYNPVSDTWISKQDFQSQGRSYAAIFHLNNEIYVTGGFHTNSINGFTSCLKLNPVQNLWTYVQDFAGGAVMGQVAVSFSNAAYVGTGMPPTTSIQRADWWRYTQDLTSISENKNNMSHITLYPNPTIDYLNIHTSKLNEKAELSVLSLEGKILIHEQFVGSILKLDLLDLPCGLYIVEITDASGTLRKKISKGPK